MLVNKLCVLFTSSVNIYSVDFYFHFDCFYEGMLFGVYSIKVFLWRARVIKDEKNDTKKYTHKKLEGKEESVKGGTHNGSYIANNRVIKKKLTTTSK